MQENQAISNLSVGIVIVHYQCLADTIRCVESLRRLTVKNFKIILVDNCSPDLSGKELNKYCPEAEVILLDKNSGFAAGCNAGISAAKDCKFIWLLNPDTTVKEDALEKLIFASDRHADVSAFGSKVLYGDKNEVIWSAGATIDLNRKEIKMLGNGEVDRGQYLSSLECDYLPGCSLFAKRMIFDFKLPEHYFMYFEETDWCFSLKQKNKKLMYVAESIVYHHTLDEKMQSEFNVYYYNRNQLYFWYKFVSHVERIKLLYSVIFNKLPQILYAISKAENLEHRKIFKAHLFANLDFILGRSGKRY